MKTSQEMVRKIGKFNVIQRTSDGYFNATNLLKQWNESIKTKSQNFGDLKQETLITFGKAQI